MAVVGRRIDRQTVMAALVDEVRGERPDRIGTEPASLRLGAQEEVDPRAPEVGLGLLDGLNVACVVPAIPEADDSLPAGAEVALWWLDRA